MSLQIVDGGESSSQFSVQRTDLSSHVLFIFSTPNQATVSELRCHSTDQQNGFIITADESVIFAYNCTGELAFYNPVNRDKIHVDLHVAHFTQDQHQDTIELKPVLFGKYKLEVRARFFHHSTTAPQAAQPSSPLVSINRDQGDDRDRVPESTILAAHRRNGPRTAAATKNDDGSGEDDDDYCDVPLFPKE